jgi:hypothetical protein
MEMRWDESEILTWRDASRKKDHLVFLIGKVVPYR